MSAGAGDKQDKLRRITVPSLERRPARLDVGYDIPYLGGYSVDGTVIYLDRRLPRFIEGVEVWRYIWVHERTEKALIDAMGWSYEKAHAAATRAEHCAVLSAGYEPRWYESLLAPWIRAADHESVTEVPADLDLTPYRDENDRRILRELMGAS